MRPPDSPEIVAVLDTRPECEVVYGIFENPDDVDLSDYGVKIDDSFHDAAARFKRQTRDKRIQSDESGWAPFWKEVWLPNPEFRVEEGDVPLVMAAANISVAENKIPDRILGYRLTRLFFKDYVQRIEAARNITTNLPILAAKFAARPPAQMRFRSV